MDRVATGLNRPIFATFAPGVSDRLFIAEQVGAIRALDLPYTNHNDGWIGFSPQDRNLYIASGDGGSSK